MDARAAFKETMKLTDMVVNAYLGDLSDADLLVRPQPNMNHIAWQLGHLISSEQQMLSMIGHNAPELPAGFAAAHTKETSTSDDRAKFASKQTYLDLMARMHAAATTALERSSDADLDKPGPKEFAEFAPTVGSVFALIATHPLMHCGQWVAVRRKLGKPVVI